MFPVGKVMAEILVVWDMGEVVNFEPCKVCCINQSIYLDLCNKDLAVPLSFPWLLLKRNYSRDPKNVVS